MKVAVFGAGYVGLTCAVGYTKQGHDVICVDIDQDRINQLSAGICPIHETNLQVYLQSFHDFPRHNDAGRLEFTTDAALAISQTEIALICVGTPSLPSGHLDTQAVFDVFHTIEETCSVGYTIVVKSTVPVGTMRKLHGVHSSLKEIELVYSPEFLQEGSALKDFFSPSRVVIGVSGSEVFTHTDRLPMFLGVRPKFPTPRLITTTFESAELSKLAANAMLAARVSFMNEIGTLAEKIGADICEVESILGSDPRIGPDHIHAGIGWGGYCLPKDVQMLIALQRDNGLTSEVVAATQTVNNQQPKLFVESIKRRYGVSAENASSHKLTLAVWGCAFKPATDDIRDSSAVNVIRQLLECGFNINLYDTAAKFPDLSNQLEQYESIIDTLDNVDGIVVLTDWKNIKDFYEKLAWSLVKQKIIFDGRGCLISQAWEKLGFEFYGLGRKPVK